MRSRPLVSFIVLAYKQERFIRDAVRSALAQTYQPLEVILADDCSPDATFEIMKDEARKYAGPHKVLVSRSDQNGGLANNFNRAYELSNGSLIVLQGGDDISAPHRTEQLVSMWLNTAADLVFSDVAVIDAEGGTIQDRWFRVPFDPSSMNVRDFIRRTGSGVLGCSAAVSRSLMVKYGGLDPAAKAEDVVLAFRALLEKGVAFVEDVLVEYRQHDNNMVLGRWRDPKFSRATRHREAVGRLGIARDLVRAWQCRGLTDVAVEAELDSFRQQCSYDVACYESGRWKSAMLAINGLLHGMSIRKTAGIVRRHVLRMP